MGCNQSVEVDPNVKKANKQISAGMNDAERVDNSIKKLLLLGTGSSGKSTLFKNLKIISTKPEEYDSSVLVESRHVIRQNIVAGILTILKKSQELYEMDQEENGACLVSMDEDIIRCIQMIVNYGGESFTEALDFVEMEQLGIIYKIYNYIYCDFAL